MGLEQSFDKFCYIPAQVNPFPENPTLQSHWKVPGWFVHDAKL